MVTGSISQYICPCFCHTLLHFNTFSTENYNTDIQLLFSYSRTSTISATSPIFSSILPFSNTSGYMKLYAFPAFFKVEMGWMDGPLFFDQVCSVKTSFERDLFPYHNTLCFITAIAANHQS